MCSFATSLFLQMLSSLFMLLVDASTSKTSYKNNIPLCRYTAFHLSISYFIDIYIFPFFTQHNVSININMHIPMCIYALICVGYIPSRYSAVSPNSPVIKHLRIYLSFIQSCYTTLDFYNWGVSFPISLHLQ